MFWRKKLPDIKKGELLPIEKGIVNSIIDGLAESDRKKMQGQLPYLRYVRRLEYSKTIVLELYPESLNAIPEEYLFTDRSEFIVATLRFTFNGVSYSAKARMVLGSLFELTTKPGYSTKDKADLEEFKLLSIEMHNQ